MFSYNLSKKSLEEFIKRQITKIDNTTFNSNELVLGESIRKDLISAGKIDENKSVSEALKTHRKMMIQHKIDHTYRVVSNIVRLALKLDVNVDFSKLLKIAALIHDIGRFEQATWNNSYSDKCYGERGNEAIKNHSHAGYHILLDEHEIDNFDIPYQYQYAALAVVNHHSDNILPEFLSRHMNSIDDLNIKKLTGSFELNAVEEVIVSALVQMVKEVDMIDILYQRKTGEYPVIPKSLNVSVDKRTLTEIANFYDIDKEQIAKHNNISVNESLSGIPILAIPSSLIEPKYLKIPEYLRKMCLNLEPLDLRQLLNKRGYNFIWSIWYQLFKFLKDIDFKDNLESIQEDNLLDEIYKNYPAEYRPLVKEAFDFTKERLITERLKGSGKIYVKEIR